MGKVAADGSEADGATFFDWKRAKNVDAADIFHLKSDIFSVLFCLLQFSHQKQICGGKQWSPQLVFELY